MTPVKTPAIIRYMRSKLLSNGKFKSRARKIILVAENIVPNSNITRTNSFTLIFVKPHLIDMKIVYAMPPTNTSNSGGRIPEKY